MTQFPSNEAQSSSYRIQRAKHNVDVSAKKLLDDVYSSSNSSANTAAWVVSTVAKHWLQLKAIASQCAMFYQYVNVQPVRYCIQNPYNIDNEAALPPGL